MTMAKRIAARVVATIGAGLLGALAIGCGGYVAVLLHR